MVLKCEEERGTGGTCIMGKVLRTEFLCEHDMKDTAPNISILVRAVRPYGVSVPDSLKIYVGQG
jgi:hypothetical protein